MRSIHLRLRNTAGITRETTKTSAFAAQKNPDAGGGGGKGAAKRSVASGSRREKKRVGRHVQLDAAHGLYITEVVVKSERQGWKSQVQKRGEGKRKTLDNL